MKGDIEIARFHHAEPLAHAQRVLTEAGIPFRCSDDSLTLDFGATSRIGSHPTCILLVPEPQVLAARAALLEAARQEVAASPDEEHYLNASTNRELLEVIGKPQDWSEYDIALTEHILRRRGISPPPVDFVRSPPPAADAQPAPVVSTDATGDELPPGTKEASRMMLLGGFLFGSLAGIWAFVIALSLLLSTEIGPDGRKQYSYSQRSRDLGLVLLFYSFAVFGAVFFYATFSRE